MNGSAYWYVTRSTGAVALGMLTTSVVLGIVQFTRWSSPRLPRFVTAGLHRNVSLLAVGFLAVHIGTAVADSFAPVGLLDAFLPFRSGYRPLWLGFGALASDMLLALVVTSLLRARLGHRAWRAVHWLAYACWPVALVHAVGTGSDDHRGWFFVTAVLCAVSVVVATLGRIATSVPSRGRSRVPAYAAVAAVAVTIAGWTASGPLRAGWARRAGTPTSLLTTEPAAVRTSTPVTTTSPTRLRVPFGASFEGSLEETGPDASGLAVVVIDGHLRGSEPGRLHIALQGTPLGGGGIEMQRSRVFLGPASVPALYAGTVRDLEGRRVVADLRAADGRRLEVTLVLDLVDPAHVTGDVRVTGAGDD